MITDTFLNSCFSIVLSNNLKVKKDTYRDLIDIILFCSKREKIDIPVTIQNKIECLYKMCELKLEDRIDDNIIDSISASEKYKKVLDFIVMKREENLLDEEIEDHLKQIGLRKKLCAMFPNFDKLLKYIESVKNGSFDTLDKVVEDGENIIKETYSNVMRSSRGDSVENATSIDLVNDDYSSIVNQIKSKYDRKNTVPSGIPIFDNELFNGGYIKSYLYIFGGGSGAGKSTLMMNSLLSQVTGSRIDGIKFSETFVDEDQNNNNNSPHVSIYLTLENPIDKTLLRMYQCLYEKTEVESIRIISPQGPDFLKNEVVKKFRKNYIPVLKYFPRFSIGCADICRIIDDTIDQYGKESLKCLFIDYLDLLKSDIKSDLHRFELGYITSLLKDLAAEYNIPVVTASQLNRSIYEVEDSRSFSLGMMSESMQKVNNADFVSLMGKDRSEDIVHMRVGKNTSGISEVSIDFKTSFKCYKFLNAYKISNTKTPPPDSSFAGLGSW